MEGQKDLKLRCEIYEGQMVVIKGVGPYHQGNEYDATIISVDNSNPKPVKVQYEVGDGFKRFTKDEFYDILVECGISDLDFGSKIYEWSDDQYDSITRHVTLIDEYKEDIRGAIQKKNFKEAGRLKKEMESYKKYDDSIRFNNRLLVSAVKREDYEAADKYNTVLENLKATGVVLDSKITSVEAPPKKQEEQNFIDVLKKAGNRALGGGIAGMLAMVTQVCSLMWIRTTMNYQYRHGSTTTEALRILYAEGGIARFYRGIAPALIQGPLSRFGDVAANAGVLSILDSYDSTRNMPIGFKTMVSSNAAAAWRIIQMPVDTVKTIMQVEGSQGLSLLRNKVKIGGPQVFYHGGVGAYAATFAGHYPWFFTHNYLSSVIPVPSETLHKLGRNAVIGFCSSFTSDVVSNSQRVLKTYRQTSSEKVSYFEAANKIIERDGVMGLFGRGLKTRILANGLQGIMFSVTWKYQEERINGR